MKSYFLPQIPVLCLDAAPRNRTRDDQAEVINDPLAVTNKLKLRVVALSLVQRMYEAPERNQNCKNLGTI